MNIYNAPPGSCRAEEAVNRILQNLPRRPTPALIAGDFNLHHNAWRPLTEGQNPSAQARQLADWAANANISLLTRYRAATHIRRGTLDLVWGSQALITARKVQADVAEDLQLLSDHLTIQILIAGGTKAQYGQPGRFRLDKLDATIFHQHLNTHIPEIAPQLFLAKLHPQPHSIDNAATSIIKAIQSSLSASTSRSKEKSTGY